MFREGDKKAQKWLPIRLLSIPVQRQGCPKRCRRLIFCLSVRSFACVNVYLTVCLLVSLSFLHLSVIPCVCLFFKLSHKLESNRSFVWFFKFVCMSVNPKKSSIHCFVSLFLCLSESRWTVFKRLVTSSCKFVSVSLSVRVSMNSV